jgi:hypothetical protein
VSSPPAASRSLPPRCGRSSNGTASNPRRNATARPGPASSSAACSAACYRPVPGVRTVLGRPRRQCEGRVDARHHAASFWT